MAAAQDRDYGVAQHGAGSRAQRQDSGNTAASHLDVLLICAVLRDSLQDARRFSTDTFFALLHLNGQFARFRTMP